MQTCNDVHCIAPMHQKQCLYFEYKDLFDCVSLLLRYAWTPLCWRVIDNRSADYIVMARRGESVMHSTPLLVVGGGGGGGDDSGGGDDDIQYEGAC